MRRFILLSVLVACPFGSDVTPRAREPAPSFSRGLTEARSPLFPAAVGVKRSPLSPTPPA